MIPIPDLSYFAVSGFISHLRQHYSKIWSSSLLLHDCELDEWDTALSDQNPQLAWWLHNRTGRTHNIYLPYTYAFCPQLTYSSWSTNFTTFLVRVMHNIYISG